MSLNCKKIDRSFLILLAQKVNSSIEHLLNIMRNIAVAKAIVAGASTNICYSKKSSGVWYTINSLGGCTSGVSLLCASINAGANISRSV
jgi:hypothetical protein